MSDTHPNVVYIYADDLGRGMLSCYGQRLFATPNIDRIADSGMRFTRAYGASICAPARACLLTGLHDVHAGRWTFNRARVYDDVLEGRLDLAQAYEMINNTGIRPRRDDLFLATVAERAGYATGQVGKLEWGFCTTGDEIRAHGWQYHYGYYDHGQCHGYYPQYVFENGEQIGIPGNTHPRFGNPAYYGPLPDGVVEHDPRCRAVHSQDLYDRKIVEFLRMHRDKPFFLYHPSQLPHGPTYYPDVFPQIAAIPGLTPIEREFASMVLRLDQTVGLILAELDDLGLTERTLVIFASDNGHWPGYEVPGRMLATQDLEGAVLDNIASKFHSDTCGDVFDGNDGMAGLKTSNWEGGVRIPFLARWPGVIQAGQVSDQLIANYDTLATVAELTGVELPHGATDGVSYLPALLGRRDSPSHDYVVYASQYGPSLVTRDGWKLRIYLRRDRIVDFALFGDDLSCFGDSVEYQLYYLPDDYREQRNLARERPDKVRDLRVSLLQECDGNLVHGTPQAHFAFYHRSAETQYQ